jgi:phage-related protein
MLSFPRREKALHQIVIYSDRSGVEPVTDYLRGLAGNESKDSRIKINKIVDYLKLLSEHGTRIGKPYVTHLEGEIWELRPLRDRILFAAIAGGRFALLHSFIKQTRKTPAREIEQAKRELAEFKGRGDNNG